MKRLEREKVIRGAYRSAILALTICCVFLGAVLVVHELAREYQVKKLNAKLDAKGVLVEKSDAEVSEFALFFEFEGDKKKIRHIFYRCSVARPATESATTEDTKEVKTETLKLSATALDNNLVKSKSCEKTDAETYNNWYNAVYMPSFTAEENKAN